jgi:hypothetical protein
MEMDRPYYSKEKFSRGGYGVEPTRMKKRGRPRRSWQRTAREEALAAEKTRGEIKKLRKNRLRQRQFVDGLYSSWSQRTLMILACVFLPTFPTILLPTSS